MADWEWILSRKVRICFLCGKESKGLMSKATVYDYTKKHKVIVYFCLECQYKKKERRESLSEYKARKFNEYYQRLKEKVAENQELATREKVEAFCGY